MLLILAALALLFILLIISFFYRVGKPVDEALSDSYYHHTWKNKIIFSPMGNWFELGYHELEADPETFVVLTRDYGKDKQFIFWRGLPQAVDHASFRLNKDRIPLDDFKVYYENSDSLTEIAGADPKTYRAYTLPSDQYPQHWYRDDESFFVTGLRVDVDAATFQRINHSLGIDSAAVYSISNDPLISSGQGAVKVTKREMNPGGAIYALSTNYARVGNTIILSNWKTDFAMVTFNTLDSVVVINERNLSVDGVLVSDGKIVVGGDADSFQEIDINYFKDKANVYFNAEVIPSADVTTFEVVSEDYSKDAKHVFYRNTLLPGANPSSFKFAWNTGIGSDGKLSFKDGQPTK